PRRDPRQAGRLPGPAQILLARRGHGPARRGSGGLMLATDSYMAELERRMERVYEIAAGYGLDPYPIHWEIVPAEILYEFGAYGLPGRFSHWTHGRAYHRQKIMYDYGLSKIYELVINSNPGYAFLLDGNSVLQNTLIAAHVIAHVDFFKNNQYYARTNRNMVEG